MRNINNPLPPAKTILALDLGKFKSVGCVLDVASNCASIPDNPHHSFCRA